MTVAYLIDSLMARASCPVDAPVIMEFCVGIDQYLAQIPAESDILPDL